jgi:quinoprotein glucose dehydrogenase
LLPVLIDVATKSDNQLARIHALWGIGQLRAADAAQEVLVSLMRDNDDEIRAQAAKVAGELRIVSSKDALIPLLRDASPRVRFMAAMALGKLKVSDAADPLVAMLAANDNKDAYLRHAGVMGLVGCADANDYRHLVGHSSSAVRRAAVVTLRKRKSPEVARYLDDTDQAVALEVARAINDVPIEDAMPQLAEVLERPKLAEPLALRALNANYRLGGAEHAGAVAKYAADTDAVETMRVQALKMLAEWKEPSGQDRVVGVWRPLPTRDASIANNAAFPLLEPIVMSAPESVRIAAIELIEKIGSPDADLLLNVVRAQDMPPPVGAAALEAMVKTSDPKLDQAVEIALKTGKGALRSVAIKQLARRNDAGQRLSAILDAGAIPDQQAVLSTLGTIEGNAAAEQILSNWMDKLLAGAVAPEAMLDLLESAEKSKNPAIRQKLETFESKRADAAKNDVLSAYRETLVGGDATLGRKIFLERAEVSCLRCHKLEGQGGVAGPDLTGIAATKDRNYLLTALLDPNKDIAPGFEAVTVNMKAGTRYTGVVRREDEREITLDAGDGATIQIIKAEVEKRTKGLSPMPQDIIKPLSKRDVRNLVEFLASLKTPATQPAAPSTATAAGAGH